MEDSELSKVGVSLCDADSVVPVTTGGRDTTDEMEVSFLTLVDTVKRLYFVGRVFRGFCKLACIREIILIEI